MEEYAKLYKEELLDNIIPFWMKHSKDAEFGGYFTCLDQYGKIFDTDKFIWLQGRETWMFSMLCDKVEKKKEWLDMALHGAEFLIKNGRDEEGNWYFSTNRYGKPLIQPYNIFSDCFAAMAFSALYKVTFNEKYADIARTTFFSILEKRDNPKGKYNKIFPGTRGLKNFALPMILCNLSLEMEHLLGKDIVDKLVREVIHEVMNVFYHEEEGVILENVLNGGKFSDSFEGRLLNPGHAIEAMWFVMDLGVRLNDPAIITKAIDITLRTLDYSWDKKFGGIYYFLDIKGHPPQQLEWDQKLWWVHMETLVCLSKAYSLTGEPRLKTWFEIVHQYTWKNFRDKEYSEWFGYLNRRGDVLLPLKGGKWKGCFHIPRGLFQVWKSLEPDSASNSPKKSLFKDTKAI